jgi:hypothetical protein
VLLFGPVERVMGSTDGCGQGHWREAGGVHGWLCWCSVGQLQ